MSVRGELHQPGDPERKIADIESPRFTIGRAGENSLSISSSIVSRSHAELIRNGDEYLLRDLGSINGSFVNGIRVSQQILKNGDILRFGNNGPEIIFKLVEIETGKFIKPSLGSTGSLIDSLLAKLSPPPDDPREEANLRRLLAEAHLERGDFDRALEVITKYNDTTNLIAIPVSFRAWVLLWLGKVYLERKHLPMAIDALQRSLKFFEQVSQAEGDITGVAGAYVALGRALVSSGDFLAARDHLNRAMLTARRAGNMKLMIETHLLVGKIDLKEGDFEGARYNWGRASRLAEGTDDALLEGRVKLQQAQVLSTEGKLKEAVPAYHDAIQQIELSGNIRFLLKAYSSLSRVLTRLGSWTATEKLLEDRLSLARRHKIPKAEAVALTDHAELKLLQGDPAAAMQSIELALKVHGQIIYPRTQRILGRILHLTHRTADAMRALERGLAEARTRGAIEEQVLIGLELALIHAEIGDLARATAELDASEAATSLDPALNLMARALYTRGSIHAKARQMDEANRCFGQSLSIFNTIGDPYRAALSHAAIGSLRLDQRRLESARGHLEEARATFAKLGAMIDLQRIDSRLSSTTLMNIRGGMTTAMPALSGTARLSMAHKLMTTPLQTPAPTQTQQILVAVANDELAEFLTRGLEVENYLIDRVRDGREALDRALNQTRDFRLLLLDALLEHISGFDLCRELRKQKRQTPVILLGGRQGLEDKIEALRSGADDYLGKRNMVFDELLAKVEALLR
jgi:tetratricopeptide (TPR) repeat protein